MSKQLQSGLDHIQLLDFTKSEELRQNLKKLPDSNLELRISMDYLNMLADIQKESEADSVNCEFMSQLRNASSYIAIGSQNKNNEAYQCDFGPIVGTSIVLEVEVTDSEESDNDEPNQKQ